MDIPCSMCLENPSAPKHRCESDSRKMCDCCEECCQACAQEWHDGYDDGCCDVDDDTIKSYQA